MLKLLDLTSCSMVCCRVMLTYLHIQGCRQFSTITSTTGVILFMSRLWNWYVKLWISVCWILHPGKVVSFVTSSKSADWHSEASRYPQPIIYQDFWGPAKPLFCNYWWEGVHEDWGWFLVPSGQGVDACNLWPPICRVAKIILLFPPLVVAPSSAIFFTGRMGAECMAEARGHFYSLPK